MDWGAGGELLAVTKLACDLYHYCFLATKEAPDEFRQLTTELGSLQGVLKTLCDDINGDGSFIDSLDPQRKLMLERCLKSCFSTLRSLQKIVSRYQEVGLGEGLQFWKRIQWNVEKPQITDMKARVMAHGCNISLCLSSIETNSLARIEARLLPALEEVHSQTDADGPGIIPEEDDDTCLMKPNGRKSSSMDIQEVADTLSRRLTETTHGDAQYDGSPTSGSPRFQTQMFTSTRHRRASSVTSKRVSPSRVSAEDELRESQANARKLLNQLPAKFTKPHQQQEQQHHQQRQERNEQRQRHWQQRQEQQKQQQKQPQKQRHDEQSEEKQTKPLPKLPGISSQSVPAPERRRERPDIKDELASAMKELTKVKQQERASRPLRIPSRKNIPRPEEWMLHEFEIDADEEMQYRKLNMRDWLRIGTWWLLKAKFNLQSMEGSIAGSSAKNSSVQTNYTKAVTQGYIDLLKTSWIVFDVVLGGNYEASLRSDENRNILYNLADGLAHEARVFQKSAPEAETLQAPEFSLHIWEPMQALEEGLGDDFGASYNSRWVTAQQGDAGAMDEKALYRTFVDAAIGGKGRKVFPKGAPYLLVLSTKEGESEPKITLCNQNGTLCLTRDFTLDDMEEFGTAASPSLDVDYYEGLQSLELCFAGMDTCISFPQESELQCFLQVPKAYFMAVKRREPRPLPKATESIIFQRSVDIVEQLHPSTMKLITKKHRFESCDMRILETTCKEGWRTTRRLVISSSACEKQPWCNEFFLPMDRVQTKSELPRQVTVKWSDCSQEDYAKTDGNYIKYFNHIYDDTRPNLSLSLYFNNEEDATDFQHTLFTLSAPVSFTWENGPAERGAIYEMVDTDPAPKKYKAIMLVLTRLDWTFSQIFYHYRDTDYKLDSKTFRLTFPQLYYSTYCSNHYKEVYRPTKTPQFSHCERRVNPTSIDFLELSSAMAFLSALSHSTLVFAAQAQHISTKAPSRLGGGTKSNKGTADVFVWRQGNAAKVVSRWGDVVTDKWISAEIPGGTLKYSADSSRASVRNAKYQRGQMLDMGNLLAVRPKNKADIMREGYLTWAFASVKDQEDFVAAVEGRAPRPYKSALDEMDEYISKLGSNVP